MRYRYLVLFISWFTLVVFFMIRANISVALLAMAKTPEEAGTKKTRCSTGTSDKNEASVELKFDDRFVWTSGQQANLLSSFYIGYVCSQFIGGLTTSLFGPKIMLIVCVSISGILTLLIPISAQYYGLLFANRVILGLFSGALYPSMQVIIGAWTPVEERTTLSTFTHTGNLVGIVLNFFIGGNMCSRSFHQDGWKYFFYFVGGLATLTTILLWLFIYDNPNLHPWISKEERNYILKSTRISSGSVKQRLKKIPWLCILKSIPFWAIVSALFAHLMIFFALLSSSTKFLKDSFNLSIKDAAYYAMVPFIFFLIVQLVYPPLIDYLRIKRKVNVTLLRRLSSGIAYVGANIFIFFVGFFDCQKSVHATILLSISLAFMGCNISGFLTAAVEIAPQYADIIMGMSNTIGSNAGIIANALAGVFIKMDYENGWKNTFIFISVTSLIFGLVFVIFGSSELQPWASKSDSQEIKKQEETA